MMHTRPFYILKRITHLGFSGLAQVLSRKTKKYIFARKYKKKALSDSAFFSWDKIAHTNKLPRDFDTFLTHVKQDTGIKKLQEHELFLRLCSGKYRNLAWILPLIKSGVTELKVQDDKLRKQSSSKTNLWHQGFENKARVFYQDIEIPAQKARSYNEYHPDIKTPWEYSRLQNIYILAQAYKNTQDPTLAHLFEQHVSDWIEHNPFLLGVNWVCPMEVAIRAVNIIWGVHAFKNAPEITPVFWEKLACILYAHAIYLEHNWETSDKPNNHYLADLVGYYYICHFFDLSPHFNKKKNTCFDTIFEQYNKQILPDGTCWEGSTAYHRLDTEMLLHVLLLHEQQITHKKTRLLNAQLTKMLEFLHDNTDSNNNFVTIGDNDSGILVTGIHTSTKPNNQQNNNTYPDFGLTIIKDVHIHVTFRHAKYKKTQPTGHFHQDELAITLSINGQPILVDPGSYLYTANNKWRNYFRSYEQHNTFYMHSQTDLELYDLFQLHKKQTVKKPDILIQKPNAIVATSFHDMLRRQVTLEAQSKTLILDDSITFSPENSPLKSLPLSWTFIFSPDVALLRKDNYWLIHVNNKPVAQLASTLNLVLQSGYFSPAYAIKTACSKLVATKTYTQNEQTIIHPL